MEFLLSERAVELREKLLKFFDQYIYPNEKVMREQVEASGNPHHYPEILDELKEVAKAEGLWNFFSPIPEVGGHLSNLDYAPLAEIMGRVSWSSSVFNCAAPDTGNMEILAEFGTEEQKERWLKPLLNGEIRSCFAMTEPDVASSDATNIQLTILREGDEYVINGRKWFISGAASPRCKISITMGKTAPDSPNKYRQQSMVLVPLDTPGLTVKRAIPVFGHSGGGGHCEILYENVRVPVSNLLGEEGGGFAISQARLGPGRIHHAMRSVGAAQRALELMCQRAHKRVAFGKPLAQQGVIQNWIAESKVQIEMVRTFALRAAWAMDTYGKKGAMEEIAIIKIAAADMHTSVLDRAIQLFGAAGVSDDFPLASMWVAGRTMHIVDGPDEVHKRSIARTELQKWAD